MSQPEEVPNLEVDLEEMERAYVEASEAEAANVIVRLMRGRSPFGWTNEDGSCEIYIREKDGTVRRVE